MTTDPDEPVILATLAGDGGEPTLLLIDGYALPDTARASVAEFRCESVVCVKARSGLTGPLRAFCLFTGRQIRASQVTWACAGAGSG